MVAPKERASLRAPAAALPFIPSSYTFSYPPSAPSVRSRVARAHAPAHGSRTLVFPSSCTRPKYFARASYLSLAASLYRSALQAPPSTERHAGPRVLPCFLPFAGHLLPSKKELASSRARQPCEVATEELVHLPSKPGVERGHRCGELSDQLAQRPFGVFGFQEIDH